MNTRIRMQYTYLRKERVWRASLRDLGTWVRIDVCLFVCL